MKRVALLFLISLVTLTTVDAQDFVLRAGAKAGGGLSGLSVSDDAADYSFGPSFHFGGFVDYSKTKIGYQLDLLYSVQTTKIKSGGDEGTAQLKFVNIPIVFKYFLSDGFNIQAGPQIGFLTCFHSDYHPVTHEPFMEQDYTKAYKKTDFGLNIGAGYTSPRGLFLDLRYYLGMSDLSNYEGVLSTKNNTLQLSVGYTLYHP